MYCKHCGKEIADDSKFCQHCGKSQDDSQSVSITMLVPFWNKHKIAISIWLAWVLLHFSLWLSSDNDGDGHYRFYPFSESLSDIITGDYIGDLTIGFFDDNSLYYYDFTEFFFYVVTFPLVLYLLWKLFSKAFPTIKGKQLPPSIKKGVSILSSGGVYLGTLLTIVIMMIGLYNSEARYAFNVEEMGNPSSGWYLRHPGSMLYAYHLMSWLLIYSVLFAIVVISFTVFYFVRIWTSNVSLAKMDRMTVWCAKIGVSLYLGNLIALIISIPTSQSISAIATTFIFSIIVAVGLSIPQIDNILKL